MTLYYHPDYIAAAHGFATTRKPAWVQADLMKHPLPGIIWSEPDPVTGADLAAAHTPAYLEAVRTGRPESLASSNGFPWDPGIWTAATRSTGGVVAAAREAYRTKRTTGSLSSGLHHARAARRGGFCTLNGLAVAARAVLAAGARRILILDLDAHGGGGTHDILADEPHVVQVDLSTDGFDRYLPAAPSVYEYVSSAARYLERLTHHLDLVHGPFDLCLYNAGVDSHENDPGGGLAGLNAGHLRKRDEQVFRWARAQEIPVAFVLAGGYPGPGHPEAAVVALHRQTIEAALHTS